MIVWTSATAATASSPAPGIVSPSSRLCAIRPISNEGGINNPTEDTNEKAPKNYRGPVDVPSALVVSPKIRPATTVFFLASGSQQEPEFYAAAPFEDVGILRRSEPFTNDIGGAKLEFDRKRYGTGPLDILLVIIRALVLASHYIDIVKTFGVSADAFQLRKSSKLM